MALEDRGGAPGANGPSVATTAYVDAADALKASIASPAFTGTPTAPTPATSDSSTTVATTAYVQAAMAAEPVVQQYKGAISSGSPYKYQRLATLDGLTATSGAHITILVAGIGDYGSNPRGVGILDIVQRGTNPAGIFARMEWIGAQPSLGTFYTVSTGSYTLEVWFQTANFQMTPHFEVLDTANATVLMDPQTSTAPTGYVEVPSNVTAPIGSPTFTGVPRSVNPPGGQNDTMIATTSWAVNLVSGKANTNSPALTGVPTTPTAAANTNTTQIASTAYVQGEISSLAPLASPALTGSPTAPTQTSTHNDTTIATTAFVKAQGYVTGGPYLPLSGGTMTGTLAVNDINWGSQGFLNSTAILNRSESLASTAEGVSSSSSTSIVTMNINGTLGHLNGPLQIPSAYSSVVTTRGVFVTAAGSFGTSASSGRLKDLLSTESWDDATLEKWLAIPVHRFKYKDGVAAPEEAHLRHMGMVAEDVHEAGFTEFVHYEEREDHEHHGRVEGLAYDRMTVLDHLAMRRMLERIEALEARLTKEAA